MTTNEGNSGSKGYHPTIQQLEWVAAQEYGGGRGRVDSREYYELVYFEPLEEFLYEALERKYYPKMDARNISVCVSVWIYAHSVDTPTYERVKDRILWLAEGTKPETAIQQTFERGFIFFNNTTNEFDQHQQHPYQQVVVTLRQDIEQFLSELVDKECAEADAALIAAGHADRIAELNEKHRQNQIHFEEQTVKFYFKENEKGERVPLTEQEQKDMIESVARGRK